MGWVIARRLGLAIPTLIGVTIIIFLLLNVLPGDPLAGLLDPSSGATAEDRERLAEELGLNDPLPVRYVEWMGGVLQLDFGYSPFRQREVAGLIASAWMNTLILAAAAAAIGVTAGVGLGTLAALNRGGWVDRIVSAISVTGISIPNYWVAILFIIIFSATLNWLPASGMHGSEGGFIDFLKHLIMPAVSLALVTIGMTARMTRASLMQTFGEDFVSTLRAKGLRERKVLLHVTKNAAAPILTVAGLQVGFLLGGSVLVETIFSWPGLGQLMVTAISARDLQVVQAAVLVIAVGFVLINLIVDIVQALIDPRLRNA